MNTGEIKINLKYEGLQTKVSNLAYYIDLLKTLSVSSNIDLGDGYDDAVMFIYSFIYLVNDLSEDVNLETEFNQWAASNMERVLNYRNQNFSQ